MLDSANLKVLRSDPMGQTTLEKGTGYENLPWVPYALSHHPRDRGTSVKPMWGGVEGSGFVDPLHRLEGESRKLYVNVSI